MKRTAMLFLASMTVGAYAQQGAPADVPRDHWAYEAVDTLFREGLLKGYPDGTFKGSRPASRYEMAGVLDRLNQRFQSQLTRLRVVDGPQNAQLMNYRVALSNLQHDVDSIKASQNEVADLTKQMNSLLEQLGKIRGDLANMRQNLPQK